MLQVALPPFSPTRIGIFKDEDVGRPAISNYQRSRSAAGGISMTNNSFGTCHTVTASRCLNFLIILGQVRGPVLSHNWVGSGNTTRELAVISSSSLLFSQPTRKLYFRRRNRWSSWRRQLPAQQECRDINDQQQFWYVLCHYVPAGPQLSHYR